MIRTYLVNFAKSFRYSTAQPAINLLAISTVYDFFESGLSVDRSRKVFQLAETLYRVLKAKGYRLTNKEPTYILGVLVEKPRVMAKELEERGFVVTPVTFPVVPKDTNRLRICIHANNTSSQIHKLVEHMEEIQNRAIL